MTEDSRRTSILDQLPKRKKPKQSRSQASLERVFKAAEELLAEKGGLEFTLTGVSKRSGVSIGAIYNHFSGKEDMLRQVQERVLLAMEMDSAMTLNTLRRQRLALRELVPAVVHEFGEYLKRHAQYLRPFMELSVEDEVIESVGSQFAHQNHGDFVQLLLECRDEIVQPDPEKAINRIFNIIFAALARNLGLGILGTSAIRGEWAETLEDLSQITLFYLLGHPDHLKS